MKLPDRLTDTFFFETTENSRKHKIIVSGKEAIKSIAERMKLSHFVSPF